MTENQAQMSSPLFSSQLCSDAARPTHRRDIVAVATDGVTNIAQCEKEKRKRKEKKRHRWGGRFGEGKLMLLLLLVKHSLPHEERY